MTNPLPPIWAATVYLAESASAASSPQFMQQDMAHAHALGMQIGSALREQLQQHVMAQYAAVMRAMFIG
jgi:hypothetical protein